MPRGKPATRGENDARGERISERRKGTTRGSATALVMCMWGCSFCCHVIARIRAQRARQVIHDAGEIRAALTLRGYGVSERQCSHVTIAGGPVNTRARERSRSAATGHPETRFGADFPTSRPNLPAPLGEIVVDTLDSCRALGAPWHRALLQAAFAKRQHEENRSASVKLRA